MHVSDARTDVNSGGSVRALGPEATARFLSELERLGNPILNLSAVEARVIPDDKK